MERSIIYLLAMLSLFSVRVEARWARLEDAPVVLEESIDKQMIKADGSFDQEWEMVLSVKKEQGIQYLQMFKFGYDPNIETLKIVSASTINPTGEIPVDLAKIEDKPVASRGSGFSSYNQLTIPFPALQVGSKVKVKGVSKHKASFFPGQYHRTISVADKFFSNSDITEITSEIPLFFKQSGTEEYVSFESGREGNLYKYKISLSRPTLRVPVGEPFPTFEGKGWPRIELSSLSDWAPIGLPMQEKFNQLLQEPLPASFQKIAEDASKLPSQQEKAKLVMAKLIEEVKYLGDWRTENGYYLPQTMQTVSVNKQGDCKDFSFSTVAILRKLGINAFVAWVNRDGSSLLGGPLQDKGDPLTPGMGHFNHAIVKAVLDGKEFWLDPTNPVSHVGNPFGDISDRLALVFDGSTTLSKIPDANVPSNLETTSYYSFRWKGKADVMAEIKAKGPIATELLRAKSMIPEEGKKYFFSNIIDIPSDPTYMGVVSEIEESKSEKTIEKMDELKELYSFEIGNSGTQTTLGFVFSLKPNRLAERFLIEAGDRVTGLDLGSPKTIKTRSLLANFRIQGDAPLRCGAQSKWANIDRQFQAGKTHLVVTDTITVKQPFVGQLEMRGKEYESFREKLKDCLQETLVIYKWQMPGQNKGDFEPFGNPLIANKNNFTDRLEGILTGTGQQYERLPYVRLLAMEQIQLDPKKSAQGLVFMSKSIKRQAYKNNAESDEKGVEEAEYLLGEAKKMDPNDFHVKMILAEDAFRKGFFDEASDLVKSALERFPNSTSAQIMAMEISIYKKNSIAVRTANLKTAEAKAEAMLNDPKVKEKLEVVEFLRSIYFKLGNEEKFESAYKKEIELNPKSAWTPLNFSGYLNDKKKFKEAETYARMAIKVAPVGMAYINLSHALSGLALEEFQANLSSKKGQEYCEAALEYYRQNHSCLLMLSALHREKTNDPAAREKGELYAKEAASLAANPGKIYLEPLDGLDKVVSDIKAETRRNNFLAQSQISFSPAANPSPAPQQAVSGGAMNSAPANPGNTNVTPTTAATSATAATAFGPPEPTGAPAAGRAPAALATPQVVPAQATVPPTGAAPK